MMRYVFTLNSHFSVVQMIRDILQAHNSATAQDPYSKHYENWQVGPD